MKGNCVSRGTQGRDCAILGEGVKKYMRYCSGRTGNELSPPGSGYGNSDIDICMGEGELGG